jgi:hypothetical protein
MPTLPTKPPHAVRSAWPPLTPAAARAEAIARRQLALNHRDARRVSIDRFRVYGPKQIAAEMRAL